MKFIVPRVCLLVYKEKGRCTLLGGKLKFQRLQLAFFGDNTNKLEALKISWFRAM